VELVLGEVTASTDGKDREESR
jgi:hypothetical protein